MNLYANTIYKPNSIRVLFQSKIEVNNAVEILKEGIPTISLEEVMFWYERFNKENFDISQDFYEQKVTPELNILPVHLKRKITDQVNIQDQDALVRVNSEFRKYLIADRRVYDLVRVHLDKNEAVLYDVNKVKGEMKIIITTTDGGCIVDKNGEKTTHKHSYVEQVLSEFQNKVRKFGTKISEMILSCNCEVDDTKKQFFKGVCDVISGVKGELHVEKLNLVTDEATHLNSILGNIKVGALTYLEFEVKTENDEDVDMRIVTNFHSHLPFFKRLISTSRLSNAPFSNCAHIGCVVFHAVVSPQELSDYKEKLNSCPTVPIHCFYTNLNGEDIKEALRPYEPSTCVIDKFDGSFRLPLCNENICFKITERGGIRFGKIEVI